MKGGWGEGGGGRQRALLMWKYKILYLKKYMNYFQKNLIKYMKNAFGSKFLTCLRLQFDCQ